MDKIVEIAHEHYRQVGAAGTPQGHGEPGDNFDYRRLPGLFGEVAVRDLLGQPQIGDVTWGSYDLGKLQIRSTIYSSGHLIAYEADKDDAIGVLVTVNIPQRRAEVVGAKPISECRVPAYRTPPPEIQEQRRETAKQLVDWWVPQYELSPLQQFVPIDFGNLVNRTDVVFSMFN